MNGLEATARIRSLNDPHLRKLPIIAFTASTDPADLRNIIDCGMNGHIVKPLTKDNLDKIRQYAGPALLK
jgi:CheY-like chemotaxis protein